MSDIDIVQEDPPRGTIGNQTCVGDIDECQRCGIKFNQSYGGYFVDEGDLGSEPDGATGRIFKKDVENGGKVWNGFEKEDIGAWCDNCSWYIQNKRSRDNAKQNAKGENQN